MKRINRHELGLVVNPSIEIRKFGFIPTHPLTHSPTHPLTPPPIPIPSVSGFCPGLGDSQARKVRSTPASLRARVTFPNRHPQNSNPINLTCWQCCGCEVGGKGERGLEGGGYSGWTVLGGARPAVGGVGGGLGAWHWQQLTTGGGGRCPAPALPDRPREGREGLGTGVGL